MKEKIKERLTIKNKEELITIMLIYLILYIVQFVIVNLFYNVIEDVDGCYYMITTVIAILIGMIKFSDKLRYWLLCIPLYMLLIRIYHPRAIYGIGIWGLFYSYYSPDVIYIGLLILFVLNILFQLGIWILVKSGKWIRKKYQMFRIKEDNIN